MSVASLATRPSIRPPIRAVPDATVTDRAAEAVSEEHRWLKLLLPPFLLSAVFFAAVIATETLWLMGPAMLGPGLIIIGLVYLGLTSDTNTA